MRPRTLLVLLAVVLALGAFIWFYERELPGSEEREELAKRAVPGLADAEVTAVVVEKAGRGVRIERVVPAGGSGEESGGADGAEDAEEEDDPFGGPPAEWRIAAPEPWAGARADAAAVEGLVSALGTLEKLRTLDDPDPAALGLEPPRVRVTLEVAEGEPYVVSLGAEVPASRDVALARPDRGEVHVVDGSIATDLLREPGDWRDRQVFPVGRADVRRVTLRGEGGEVVLAAEGAEGGLRVVQPFADRADRDAVERLLADLVRLRADRFVDDPPAGEELGLDPPRGVVEIAAGGRAEPVRLEVGAPAADGSGTYLRLADQTFTAATEAPAALARPAADWRSRRLTGLEAFRVDRVAVSGPGGPTVLERTGSDWTRDGERIPYTPVSDLVYALTEAEAERVEPGAPPGAPSLTIALTAGAGGDAAEVVETIELRPARANLVPATVSGRPVTLLLPAATVDEIRAALDRVREAEPLGPPPGDDLPEGVELEREEGGG